MLEARAMSDTKEVNVTLSDADVKAFSRGGTRRGRKPRTAVVQSDEQMNGGGAIADTAATVGSSGLLTVTPVPTPVTTPSAQLITVVPAAVSVASPSPVSSPPPATLVGGSAPVKIQAKKLTGVKTPAIAAPHTAKIIPTKKHISAAPAARTLKKPRLVVGGAQPTPVEVTTHAPQDSTNAQKGGVQAPVPAHQQKRHRRFTERRISIEVNSAKATRRHRRKIKSNIAAMPINKVHDILLAKGVLKPKPDHKLPPDDMMRSMLKDYMLLHTAE